MQTGTFSIVARCRKTGDFGVATETAAPCVGAFLPHAVEGVGAIATQAWVNVNLGYQGLELMARGLGVKAAIESLLLEDQGRAKRQVIGIDRKSVFAFTGEACSEAKGALLGEDYAVAGNILVDTRVLDRIAAEFKRSKGELPGRLLDAIEAGQDAGGDRRGKTSAALLVASSKPKLYHNLRVDMHENPLGELKRIFERCQQLQAEFGDDEDGEVLRRRVTRIDRP